MARQEEPSIFPHVSNPKGRIVVESMETQSINKDKSTKQLTTHIWLVEANILCTKY